MYVTLLQDNYGVRLEHTLKTFALRHVRAINAYLEGALAAGASKRSYG